MFSYHASRDMCGNAYRETQAFRTKSSQCSRIWLCSRQAIESVMRHFRAIHPCPFWHCLATLLWNWHDSGPNGFCKGHSFGLQTGFTLDPLHPNSSKYLGPMMWDIVGLYQIHPINLARFVARKNSYNFSRFVFRSPFWVAFCSLNSYAFFLDFPSVFGRHPPLSLPLWHLEDFMIGESKQTATCGFSARPGTSNLFHLGLANVWMEIENARDLSHWGCLHLRWR